MREISIVEKMWALNAREETWERVHFFSGDTEKRRN